MNYMIFKSRGAAEVAQSRLLKLWSQYLSTLGYGRNDKFAVNTGIRGGRGVETVTIRWSDVIECEEGWAIAHPEKHLFEDGVLFSMTLCKNYGASKLMELGIPNKNNMLGLPYVESDKITLLPIEMENL